MSMQSSYNTIWNRTRDIPAYSAVPQPTALSRNSYIEIKKLMKYCLGAVIN
jgi:hypothetical protein